MNYLDLVIIAGLIYYLYDGYRRGFMNIIAELVVFIIAIVTAFYLCGPVGHQVALWLGLPKVYGPAFGFVVVWFGVQLILSVVKKFLHLSLAKELQESLGNKIGGIFISFCRGIVFIALILLFITIMPISSKVRDIINNSAIGSRMVNKGGYLDSVVSQSFGSAANEMVTFLTVNPLKQESPSITGRILEPTEVLHLGYKTTDVKVDQVAEAKMLELVNNGRTTRGLSILISDDQLQNLARTHARDMFQRGYFAHISPDGETPFDRMAEAGIGYQVAGENLALAPTVLLAHNGLMNSPGHRANILESSFGHVGIGVIDGGIYGKMFVQEFKD
ncbi:MAG: CvpA family protein [bacterium]|nr:CvpA family protein [bacterium]